MCSLHFFSLWFLRTALRQSRRKTFLVIFGHNMYMEHWETATKATVDFSSPAMLFARGCRSAEVHAGQCSREYFSLNMAIVIDIIHDGVNYRN